MFLIRVACPNCGRTYRYSNDAPENEQLCPFSDCIEQTQAKTQAKTAAAAYFAEQMKDPAYRNAYNAEKKRLAKETS